MNRFRLFLIGTMLTFALAASAQQSTVAAEPQPDGQAPVQNTVDQHLKMLSEELGLSVGQQAEIRPILQQMMDARQKVMQDGSLSNEAREQKQKSLHENADKRARKFLNDEQKKKLDQLEQEPHAGSHGSE